MGKWEKCLWGMVLITVMPNMIYAANTAQNISSEVVKNIISPSQCVETTIVKEDIGYIRPISQEAELLAPFGQVRNGYNHQGIDLRLPIGTPVYAIADATVIKAAPDSKGINAGGGNIIMLDHKDGVQSWYMHLDAYAVNVGDEVKKGQLIGYSGNSGESSTPHLHFEYRLNGTPVDPTFIIENGQLVEKVADEVNREVEKSLITLDEPFLVIQS